MIGKRLDVANKKAFRVWVKYFARTQVEFDAGAHWFSDDFEFPPIGGYRKTKVFCSNPFCCGNPRRRRGTNSEKFTMQELRAKLDEREQLNGDMGGTPTRVL